MLLISTYVAPSQIEGLGVFAGEFVPAGNLIWTLNHKFDIFFHETELAPLLPHVQTFLAR
jgi:SET domain-containing protein